MITIATILITIATILITTTITDTDSNTAGNVAVERLYLFFIFAKDSYIEEGQFETSDAAGLSRVIF